MQDPTPSDLGSCDWVGGTGLGGKWGLEGGGFETGSGYEGMGWEGRGWE